MAPYYPICRLHVTPLIVALQVLEVFVAIITMCLSAYLMSTDAAWYNVFNLITALLTLIQLFASIAEVRLIVSLVFEPLLFILWIVALAGVVTGSGYTPGNDCRDVFTIATGEDVYDPGFYYTSAGCVLVKLMIALNALSCTDDGVAVGNGVSILLGVMTVYTFYMVRENRRSKGKQPRTPAVEDGNGAFADYRGNMPVVPRGGTPLLKPREKVDGMQKADSTAKSEAKIVAVVLETRD
ncbi:hypothetical protein RUND412_002095 [Rhizina undulata]